GRFPIRISQIPLLEWLQGCKILKELESFDNVGIGKTAVLVLVRRLHSLLTQDAHHKHGGIEMERPFVLAARRYPDNARRLTFLDCVNKILPILDSGWGHADLLAHVFIVPEDDRAQRR